MEMSRDEKAKVEAIIDAIGDGLSIQDIHFRILYQNRIAKEMFGDRVGEYCYRIYEKREDVCPLCPLAMTFEDGKIHRVERRNPSRTLQVEITTSPIRDSSGKITAGIEVARDITARKIAEKMLKESEERYRDLFENAHDMIQSVDCAGRFIFVNTSWFRTLGYSRDDIRTITLFDILHPDSKDHCAEIFKTVMSGQAVNNIEAIFVAKDGRNIHVEGNVSVRIADGRVIATQGIFRDITERKKAEDEKGKLELQLRHAQKVEAIGTLTSGIAHEFNNILTTIIGYGELLQEGMDKSDPLRTYVDVVVGSAMKAATLTHGLLAYSRKQIINLRPVRINDVVGDVGRLLSRLIGEHIELKNVLAAEDIIVMADPGQIEQVLMNLATNARDAMPEGGDLSIETGCRTLDGESREGNGRVKPGKYAFIGVTDTGTGIDEKTQERIFEPFFTTKETGKGTGLGLAVAYGIIKQHKGYINVSSEPGRGTTFRIYLPVMELDIEESHDVVTASMRRGSETILVAEDDRTVRELVQEILDRCGYKVIAAENGEEAVNMFKENVDGIHLLLFDVMMPKKNGREAYQEIKRIKSDIKAVFFSGYKTDPVLNGPIVDEGQSLMLKPIQKNDLAERIRAILDS